MFTPNSSFCKEILEHVIEILNFNVTRPIIEYASPVWDTNNATIKMSSKRLKVFKEKQLDLF